jgi:hypothetical protein
VVPTRYSRQGNFCGARVVSYSHTEQPECFFGLTPKTSHSLHLEAVAFTCERFTDITSNNLARSPNCLKLYGQASRAISTG